MWTFVSGSSNCIKPIRQIQIRCQVRCIQIDLDLPEVLVATAVDFFSHVMIEQLLYHLRPLEVLLHLYLSGQTALVVGGLRRSVHVGCSTVVTLIIHRIAAEIRQLILLLGEFKLLYR